MNQNNINGLQEVRSSGVCEVRSSNSNMNSVLKALKDYDGEVYTPLNRKENEVYQKK